MAENLLPDGAYDFLGGQDASKFPSRISDNAYAAGVNISVQNSLPTPRWGLDKRRFKFPDTDLHVANGVMIPYREIFMDGRFQMGAPYTIGGDFYVLTVMSGIIYLLNIDTYEAKVISLPGNDTLNQYAARLNWSNADKYLTIFDYPNYPVIFDGITARRADPLQDEIPVSTIGAYNQNRLFIGNAGSEFTAGDPVGSLAAPKAPVTFQEVLEPASNFFGQIFGLPTAVHQPTITAMGFLEFVDTSTGIGPLFIATKNYIFTCNSQNPRSAWENGQFTSLTVSSGGIAGPRAFVNVNADLFFLGSDGQVRTLSMSRTEQGKWSRTPISREIQDWLIYNDPQLIQYGFLGYFQNKVFVAVNPYRVTAYTQNRTPIFDVAHGGFAVMELDNVASLQGTAPPVWAGLWTGVRPMEMVVVNNRCFVISKDEGVNEIYEFNPNTTYDTDGEDIRLVRSVIRTKEFDFKSPYVVKELYGLDATIRNIQGDFTFEVKYKPSHGTQFIEWDTFHHYAPWRSCGVPDSCSVNGLEPHSLRDFTLGNAKETQCDSVEFLKYDAFKKAQLEFTIQGIYWELHDYAAKAAPIPVNPQISICNLKDDVKLCGVCNNDWSVGAFKSCLSLKT